MGNICCATPNDNFDITFSGKGKQLIGNSGMTLDEKSTFKAIGKTKKKLEFKEIIVDASLELLEKQTNTIDIKEALKQRGQLMKQIEACNNDCQLIDTKMEHGFFSAVRIAHSFHYPLCFSPDHIWTLIIQGFSKHMELHHEELRSQFVDFDGKKQLVSVDSGFKKGDPNNDWPMVFPQFCEQIQENIGKENHQNLMPVFSTTNATSRIVHQLSLINAMKQFFEYTNLCGCGISKVKLLGKLEDWERLRETTKNLSIYGLEWWTKNLDEVLEKFIQAYKGEVDKDFWKFIYKYYHGGASGGAPTVDGWFLMFIPYIEERQNEYAKRSLKECIELYTSNETKHANKNHWFESNPGQNKEELYESTAGINVTPFKWKIKTKEYRMNFVSGFAGSTLRPDGYIMPQLGWGVSDRPTLTEQSALDAQRVAMNESDDY